MRLTISIRKLILALVIVTALLAVLTIAAQLYRSVASPQTRNLFGIVTLLDMKKEESIHTWYSEILLLFASVLFALIWLVKRSTGDRYTRHWAGLSVILLYLSVDEGASIHEKMGHLGRLVMGTLNISQSGFLAYAWIVPASILILAVAFVYTRFFFHLPTRERIFFFLSAALFVGGSIFLESVSAFYVSAHGGQQAMNLVQQTTVILITTAEEVAEVAAVILLIYTLLTYLRVHLEEVTIAINKRASINSKVSYSNVRKD